MWLCSAASACRGALSRRFVCDDTWTCLSGLTRFDLFVDAEKVPSDAEKVPSTVDMAFGAGGVVEAKYNLSNFRGGLSAGPHTFRGEWYLLGMLVDAREATIEFV